MKVKSKKDVIWLGVIYKTKNGIVEVPVECDYKLEKVKQAKAK